MNERLLPFLIRTFPAIVFAAACLICFFSPVLLPQRSLAADGAVDCILVEKSKRKMTLLKKGTEVKSYNIALGRNPEGFKVKQGDNKTPEGSYFIDHKFRNSVYHRAMLLSYPNPADVERAKALGVPPGGSIMIHGMKPDKLWMGDVQYLFNWTNGCIALTNPEIEEIFDLVSEGTSVEIRP
jgi:murein L,D-transpeptidase YafK